MNLSIFAADNFTFVNCECVNGLSFDLYGIRGKSAVLTEKFPILTANLAVLQDICVHFRDFNASHHINIS